MKRRYMKHLTVGPGGRKCICCFPAPRKWERRLAFRKMKRRDKQEAFNIEEANGRAE